MAENESQENTNRKKVRQPISVPFLWEEKPGTPKKDWKPTPKQAPPASLPVKLVASVPFQWEEKLGTPLPSYPQLVAFSAPTADEELASLFSSERQFEENHEENTSFTLTPTWLEGNEKNRLNVPVKLVASVPFQWEEKPGTPLSCFPQPPASSAPTADEELASLFSCERQFEGNHEEKISFTSTPTWFEGNEKNRLNDEDCLALWDIYGSDQLEQASGLFNLENDGWFNSSPPLLANGLVPTAQLSSAVPLQQISTISTDLVGLQNPTSPGSDTDSSTSSYVTGSTSLSGPSFLEWLFPLLSPDSDFRRKNCGIEKTDPATPANLDNKDPNSESIPPPIIQRPPTLGELIMMSRRRSYHRKALHPRQHSFSMEMVKGNLFGCGILGISNNIAGWNTKWRRHLQLKLF